MELVLDNFVSYIKETLKDNLVSVILYGSKAGDIDSGNKSDFNLLLVLKELNYSDLQNLETKLLKKWTQRGNPIPLIFGESEIVNSQDVFPIEFLDITGSHRVLYGKDVLENMKIDDANLRHECEYELKSKLLKLRQQWLIYSKNEKILKEILIRSISSFLSILKYVVKLAGEAIPSRRIDTVEIIKKRCGIDPELFRLIYRIKHGEKDLPRYKPDDLMKNYLKDIEKVIVFVDGL
jgi:hypothetical protein